MWGLCDWGSWTEKCPIGSLLIEWLGPIMCTTNCPSWRLRYLPPLLLNLDGLSWLLMAGCLLQMGAPSWPAMAPENRVSIQYKQSLLGSAQALPAWNNMMLGVENILWRLTRNSYTISLTFCCLFIYVWRDEWRCGAPTPHYVSLVDFGGKKKFGWFFTWWLLYLKLLNYICRVKN